MNKDERITIRLTTADRRLIERAAEIDGRSISDWTARTAIAAALAILGNKSETRAIRGQKAKRVGLSD